MNVVATQNELLIKAALNGTIEKVKNESFDKISYIKLKNLNESL